MVDDLHERISAALETIVTDKAKRLFDANGKSRKR